MDRTALAEALLRDAVQRSRLERAAPFGSTGPSTGSIGQCGLGERPSAAPELDERARVLSAQLWPDGLAEDGLRRVRDICDRWVIEQDDLDRKRNHFLKDFRKRHGFARNAYSAAELAAYEAGLAAINAEEDRARSKSAEAVLATRSSSSADASERGA